MLWHYHLNRHSIFNQKLIFLRTVFIFKYFIKFNTIVFTLIFDDSFREEEIFKKFKKIIQKLLEVSKCILVFCKI